MKKATYDKTSRRHTIITALGITVLAFLILISIAGATQDPMVWNYKGNFLSDQNNKAIEINPQNSDAWDSKVDPLNKLKRYDEAVNAQNKANEINLKKSKSGTEGNNGE
jgi:tetratricopeptide (TPR) repeat protein